MVKRKEKSRNLLEIYFMIIIKVGIVEELYQRVNSMPRPLR